MVHCHVGSQNDFLITVTAVKGIVNQRITGNGTYGVGSIGVAYLNTGKKILVHSINEEEDL